MLWLVARRHDSPGAVVCVCAVYLYRGWVMNGVCRYIELQRVKAGCEACVNICGIGI